MPTTTDILKLMEGHRLSAMPPTDSADAESASKPKRSWKAKFQDALRGVKYGIRGHSSFFVHFFFTALVVAAAVVLGCGPISWGILLFCIGLVLTAELFNSAIETLYQGLDERGKVRSRRALDIAAGAVLFASITAAVVGGFIFLYKLGQMFGPEWLPQVPGW